MSETTSVNPATARGRRPAWAIALLVLISAAVYGPGACSTPVIDRDEARFAQASRQMLEAVTLDADARDASLHGGGLVAPMVGDRPRLNKPPLIYWLQSAAVGTLTLGDPSRDAIWMYRVPSVLAAMVSVLATAWLGTRIGGWRVGLFAGAMLLVCPLFAWEARQARADQVMVACTTLSMAALHAMQGAIGRRRTVALLLVALGVSLGVLAKGPITPMIVALSWLARRLGGWTTELRWRDGLVLAGVVSAMLAPWVIALAARFGWSELGSIWYDEVIARSASAKEGHAGPPGYHLVLLAGLFWPGCLLTLWALGRAVRLAWRVRTKGATAAISEPFLLAWILPAWLVFELVGTKLPHYTMPLYPPIAIITALSLVRVQRLARRGVNVRLGLGLLIWISIGAAWLVGATIGVGWPGWVDAAAWAPPERRMALTGLAAACGVIALIHSIRPLHRGDWLITHAIALGAMVLWHVVVGGVLMAQHRDLWVTQRIEHALRADGWTPNAPLAAVGYHEDSLVFASRGRLERLDDLASAADWAPGAPARWIVAPAGDLNGLRPDWTPIAPVQGLNYSRGDWVRLVVARQRAEGTRP
ncbi:MAG: glycosyltransferase family 39 protein [Planctomycetota bacterium]